MSRRRKTMGLEGAKRHRKILPDTFQSISKSAIRRLARRGGVKRVFGVVYEETRGVLKAFMENVICDAVMYSELDNRKTVTVVDLAYALRRRGKIIYGFGG